jgi:hypothetical protein
MTTPIARKMVNALVADAEMDFLVKYLLNAANLGFADVVLTEFKKAMGGLWVGGTATLYESKLAFHPNLMNRLVHAGDYSIEIPLREITDIQIRFGFVTKIIDIKTAHGTLSIRCYGAESFAETIRTLKTAELALTSAAVAPSPTPFVPALPSAAAPASLNIESTPLGADIEIDGAFVGNTPSSVTVA